MMHRGDIYLVNLTDQVGSEQSGVRPAVVVQNELGNAYSPTTIVCPLIFVGNARQLNPGRGRDNQRQHCSLRASESYRQDSYY